MAYVALFPDAPMAIADAVQVRHRAAFASQLEVTNRIPNPRPAEFVRVLGVGGVRRDRVTDVPTLAVEAWASTRSRAAALAQEVRAVIASLEGATFAGYTVQDVDEYAGPGDLPDPLSDQSRYTATYAVTVRSEIAVNINP
jgi:hypothetical protein